MANTLRWEVIPDQIAVITFDQPGARANVMSAPVLAELEQVVGEIEARKDLKGLILRSGKPGMFIAGADLKELGAVSREQAPVMIKRGLDLMARIEALPYPTVAAIEGPAMGGGLEIALAFDFRVVSTHPKTELGLPETKVGLIPGWGGTQRLPRIVGPAIAVDMIATGEGAKPQRAVEIGLAFDAVPSERLMDDAARLVKEAGSTSQEMESAARSSVLSSQYSVLDWKASRRRKQQPVGLTEEQLTYTFAVAKGGIMMKTKGQFPAPLAAAEVVEKSCNKTLEDGLRIETEAFLKLVGSPISRNLIAVFFMNQRLAKDPGVTPPQSPPYLGREGEVKPREVQRLGVIGAGLMGAGIAGAFIRKGLHTIMMDSVPAALEKGVGAIQTVMQTRVEIGRMKPEEVLAALGKLTTTGSLSAMSDRQAVVEAVIENEAEKVKVYRELQEYLPAESILASNTSTISITRMAKSVRNPELFAGMHFFNPVDRMALVEVIRGEKTNDATVVTLVALAKAIGKSPIVVKDCPGFLVNRILFPYINESLVLLEEGAGPREIDRAATAFGMPMGPITLNDVVGNDTALYAGNVVNKAFADRAATTRILDELVKAGRLGQKSGAGFYSYAKDPKKGGDDPAFAAILEKCRKQARQISQEEITDRLFLPMLLEATRCLAEGIVRDPADVDMGLILGLGFPAWRGGILRWCDSLGADKVVERLKKYEHLGPRFVPTESLRRLAAEKRRWYGD
jgi:3-hydroxyacyl-CoA dehydrogenase/enoyl-CoA hydratase/3-hydroxybutyryl-CoA epimerase/3-hydroxyacyl-CoA dehydrogenase/enoyl-CoA hydratase/3-hydroxybutyryl-CoA epimerase/enoyl-CoA isomerase